MKKDPGGGAGVWAKAFDERDMTETIVPARTVHLLFMTSPAVDESQGSSFAGKYDEREALAQESACGGATIGWLRINGLIADHCKNRSVF